MKFKVGKVYALTFWDHSTGFKKPSKCAAWGYVLADEPDYVYLTSWLVDSDDKEMVNDNLEDFVVLKCCLINKRLMS